MNLHQILTGAVNAGDNCYSVGSVEGVAFTSYSAGCNIVILANDFQRVQIIPGILHGNVQVTCIDCSTDVGKIAAAYGKKVCIFEPTPLLHQNSPHKLDYKWIQTAALETDCFVSVISWNIEGNKLLTGGSSIQLWHLCGPQEEDSNLNDKNPIDQENSNQSIDQMRWECVWQCKTSLPVFFLRFSPDGNLFVSAGKNDRLAKIWYEGTAKIDNFDSSEHFKTPSQASYPINDVNYNFIYIAHPRAITSISWRKTSKYMARGSVANMLVTSCKDNVCRIWIQTLLPDDGLVNFSQIQGISDHSNLQSHSHRHSQRILNRIRHMRNFNHLKKRKLDSHHTNEPMPAIPNTFSINNFHTFSICNASISPGFHFHLATSINSTSSDIPLVPSLSNDNYHFNGSRNYPNFVIHWLNNKEMVFTRSAEKILQSMSTKIISADPYYQVHCEKENYLDEEHDEQDQKDANINATDTTKKFRNKLPRFGRKHKRHPDDQPLDTSDPKLNRAQSSHTLSSNDTDTSNLNGASIQFNSILEHELNSLLKTWNSMTDMLFSIHPIDGSLLVWLVEWLDEAYPGLFRQPRVSFSARIPFAIPFGDAATMSQSLALYSPYTHLDLKSTMTASSVMSNLDSKFLGEVENTFPSPTVCMVTKHNNGSLNLWSIIFAEDSKFTQVMNIRHSRRVCGHRFRVNDISCHPVLPLLLTTSHHNLPGSNISNLVNSPSSPSSISSGSLSPSLCCPPQIQGVPNSGFCSELILWKVEPVGPLLKCGGVTELARINSLETSAFANVAWIPTLLPSTTLDSLSNSPSACFIASDGHQLRVYQAVIDARTLLSKISASDRTSPSCISQSEDTSSSEFCLKNDWNQAFKIVSLQSTSRPGCILQLDEISDAVHDWQKTQMLHVFQEQLIRGDKISFKSWQEKCSLGNIAEPSLGAVVDLRNTLVFQEPFFLVIIEKDEQNRSVLHMWRLIISSQSNDSPSKPSHIQEDSDLETSSRSISPEISNEPKEQANALSSVRPLQILTKKVCTQVISLPEGVEIIHSTPSAGHLSSSNIYPACFAPYLICTACNDGFIRFWRCEVEENNSNDTEYRWVEWKMLLNKKKSSAIEAPGVPLYVSCAYSGRIAYAYKHGQSYSRVTSKDPNARYININLAIYECESTGGSEWILEDTIHLKDIMVPQTELGIGIDLRPLIDTTLRNKKTSDTLMTKLGGMNELTESRSATNIQRLLSVPSYTTMQSLKKIISEQGNQFTLTQKSIVQLDWASTEDGSHILTVSVGDKFSVFTPVSTDIAQANLQAMNSSMKSITTPSSRVLLKQVSSIAIPMNKADDIKWMNLRTTNLRTADGLPPLPMHMSWVRDGILVLGMDNEMHIYTQWKSNQTPSFETSTEVTDSRLLTEQELLIHAQESSHLRLPSHASLPRSSSSSLISSGDNKKSQCNITNFDRQVDANKDTYLSQLPDFGIFETSRLACPVLPQYHPKQLMELLAFGKIQRVRAILSHLVRSLKSMGSLKSHLSQPQKFNYTGKQNSRSYIRSRTLSVAAPSSPGINSLDAETHISSIAEEVQLDYTEITSIRPLPLFALIEAEFEESKRAPERIRKDGKGNNESEYDSLFNPSIKSQIDETLDEILEKTHAIKSQLNPQEDEFDLTNFTPNQASLLTKLLTHSHLPGLSSLDQVHLLALADAVASFNPSNSDIGENRIDGQDYREEQTISPDSLDEYSLRFLLAMRQHIYLLRCLPLGHRKLLQKHGLASCNLVWAFHSETQEELIQLIPSVAKDNPKWAELRNLGVGWWIRSNFTLKRLIERLAKATFKVNNDPLDAALFYIAMKKKSLVWGLYRSIGNHRMTEFFQNNFTQDKWRKAALKNAYVLLGKQRFEHAAAFFLLANDVWAAVEVCLNKLSDLQLAMIIVRLYEGDLETVPSTLKKILYQEILGYDDKGENQDLSLAHPDPFLRSMAYWTLQDYNSALTTLLEQDVGQDHPKFISDVDKNENSAGPSVFNFYLYLRNQPMIVKRQIAQSKNNKLLANAINEKIDSKYSKEAISPFERRLYFITAHKHFRAGCPSLALEVLSRLPQNIADDESILSKEKSLEKSEEKRPLNENKYSELFDMTSNKTKDSNFDFDWSTPIYEIEQKFKIESPPQSSDDEDVDFGLQMKVKSDSLSSINQIEEVKIDIMAQQLKFIACLKILMEELSTLATGFEIDGGQLRYHLCVWLEKSVNALKIICNYRTFSMRSGYTLSENYSERCRSLLSYTPASNIQTDNQKESHSKASNIDDSQNTLHEVLLAENLDFEAKLVRATQRKEWLQGNEALLRTLLSYCSLHGSHGGGLSSVRMELMLLLQELQQERSQYQLLSPLPFPTLPLLAASVACQKTVIADPTRHLHAVTSDILEEIIRLKIPPLTLPSNYCQVFVLKDLGLSLSACVYQSLCNSDSLDLKPGTKDDLLSASVVCANSHLLAANNAMKFSSRLPEPPPITTAPNKWPGVRALRALLETDRDEDCPKLHTLLCETYVAVYLSQLLFALVACNSHILYRLIGHDFSESKWFKLFGGGAEKRIHSNKKHNYQISQPSTEQTSSIDFINNLSIHRRNLHIKILKLNQAEKLKEKSQPDEGKVVREQFVPPQMSIISFLLSKPELKDELSYLDYDSSESVKSEDEDVKIKCFEDIDDKTFNGSTNEKLNGTFFSSISTDIKNPDVYQYAWILMRFAVIKLAQNHLTQFLNVSGIEFQELPTASPLLHAVYKTMQIWCDYMKMHMESFNGPPDHFLPRTFVESSRHLDGRVWKYRVLLETNNTPFRSHNSVTKPMKRLWNYLVKQKEVQDIFVRYIFGRSKEICEITKSSDQEDNIKENEVRNEPVRIVHKEQENISAFCINPRKTMVVALSTPKEIQELNIQALLEPTPWLENEAEYDILNMMKSPETLPSSNFLVVQHSSDRLSNSPGSKALNSSNQSSNTHSSKVLLPKHHFTGNTNPLFCQYVFERSRHILKPLKRHKSEGTRRLCSHPELPLYLSGSQDGSVHLWEWEHQHPLATPRSSGTFAKVSKVLFNQVGNKFGVTDGDGNLSLWQVATCSIKPYFSMQVHSKQASDFTFLGSSSLLVTAGHSHDHKNVCLWDTLLPAKKAMVAHFPCHEQHGASSVLYAPLNQLLITAGKRGEVYIFDMRQRSQKYKIQAHDGCAIKCMCLDPSEEVFVTGSADGDIKVWSISHNMYDTPLYSFPGEHSRSTLFRNIGIGVSNLYLDCSQRLYSCGADGSLKLRQLPRNIVCP